MTESWWDFRGIVRMRVRDAGEDVVGLLRRRFSRFAVEGPAPAGDAEIQIGPLAADAVESQIDWNVESPYGMDLVHHRGRRAVGFHHRGERDVILVPGDPIELHYLPHPRSANRVYGMALYALSLALRRRDGLLFHGAAAVRDGFGIVLAGLRGTKKTQILLTLLREGWSYLADDKLILHGGRGHLFQTFVGLADHHLEALPWLEGLLPRASRTTKSQFRRKLRSTLGRMASKSLPRPLFAVAAKIANPVENVDATDLFPDVPLQVEHSLDALVLLNSAPTLACRPQERPAILGEVLAVQELLFYRMGPLEGLIRSCRDDAAPDLGPIAARNFAASRCYRLEIPPACDPETAARELTRLLQDSQPSV